MLIIKAIDLYLLDCRIRRLKPNSIKSYAMLLHRFRANMTVTDLGQLTKAMLSDYAVSLSNHAPQYQKNNIVALNSWLLYLHSEGMIDKLTIPIPKVEVQVKKALTKAEIKTLLKACRNDRDKLIVQVLLDTGIRSNELMNIKIEDIDLDQGLIIIRQGKTGQRYVSIGYKVRKALLLFIDKSSGYLFTTNRGKQLNKSSFQSMFKRLQRRTGIKHLSSHSLRRTFATSLMRQRVNVHLIAKLMGHKSIDTLKHYLDITLEDIQDISPVDNL